MFFKSVRNKVVLGVTLASASVISFADDAIGKAGDVDLSALTNNIGFGGVIIALMSLAGSIVTLYGAFAGIRWVLRTVKGV